LAPLSGVMFAEIIGGKFSHEIPIRADVIIYHIEDYSEADTVGATDEASKVVRFAVETRRCKQVHPIVAPTEATGKVRNGHDLKKCNTEVGQMRQAVGRRRPISLTGKRSSVHLVKHVSLTSDSSPGII